MQLFLSFQPRQCISNLVGMFTNIGASAIFKEHPEVKQELWGVEFWEGRYFLRTVGDNVTKHVIWNFIKYHRE